LGQAANFFLTLGRRGRRCSIVLFERDGAPVVFPFFPRFGLMEETLCSLLPALYFCLSNPPVATLWHAISLYSASPFYRPLRFS